MIREARVIDPNRHLQPSSTRLSARTAKLLEQETVSEGGCAHDVVDIVRV